MFEFIVIMLFFYVFAVAAVVLYTLFCLAMFPYYKRHNGKKNIKQYLKKYLTL